jgi:hypothetical protein
MVDVSKGVHCDHICISVQEREKSAAAWHVTSVSPVWGQGRMKGEGKRGWGEGSKIWRGPKRDATETEGGALRKGGNDGAGGCSGGGLCSPTSAPDSAPLVPYIGLTVLFRVCVGPWGPASVHQCTVCAGWHWSTLTCATLYLSRGLGVGFMPTHCNNK